MHVVARVSFADGALFVPMKTPYECQVMMEYVELYTRRYGQTRLEVGRNKWMVKLTNGHPETCGSCKGQLGGMAYTLADRSLCRSCARRRLDSAGKAEGISGSMHRWRGVLGGALSIGLSALLWYTILRAPGIVLN